MQGKGGVGKSTSAALFYQYLLVKGVLVSGLDTDPVNASLAGYGELNVPILDLMLDEDINPRAFDQVVNAVCALPPEGHIVIDIGATCFIPLCSYLKESKALELLVDEGHEVLIHTPVVGGPAMAFALNGLKAMSEHFDIPIVVWLNRFFGEIVMDGADFFEFRIYKETAPSIRSVIRIPQRKADTYGRDFQELLARRQSFQDAIHSDLPLMTRSRLARLWRDMELAIDGAGLI